jgi:hypothetical protein
MTKMVKDEIALRIERMKVLMAKIVPVPPEWLEGVKPAAPPGPPTFLEFVVGKLLGPAARRSSTKGEFSGHARLVLATTAIAPPCIRCPTRKLQERRKANLNRNRCPN